MGPTNQVRYPWVNKPIPTFFVSHGSNVDKIPHASSCKDTTISIQRQPTARTHSSTYSRLANLSSMQLSCKGKLRPWKDKPRLRHLSPCKLMLDKLRPHLCTLKLYLRQGNLSTCNSHAKAR